MTDVYFGNWSSKEDMAKDFNPAYDGEPLHKAMAADVVFAAYGIDGYEGEAIVLFREGGKLYEVHGSHCSCYGLENQWNPEEIEPDVLLQRIDRADAYAVEYPYKEQIAAALKS